MKPQKAFWRVWLALLAVLLAVGGYAAYSTIVISHSAMRYGAVDAWAYPAYAIPYIPVFLALLAVLLAMPFLLRLGRRAQLPAVSLLGLAVAVPAELLLERVPVYDSIHGLQDIQSWQTGMCSVTPAVRRTIAGLAFGERSLAVKAHFYLIALVLLVAAHLLWRYSSLAYTGERAYRGPLVAQTVCYAVFLGLCILACFTAFFRTGNIVVSPASALLMALFFLCMGVTVGVYTGCLLFGKRRPVSLGLPVLAALLAAAAMYVGELMLLGGELFRLGESALFRPLPGIPLAAADVMVVLGAGGCTLVLLRWLHRRGRVAGEKAEGEGA